jgi:hypothetical protein
MKYDGWFREHPGALRAVKGFSYIDSFSGWLVYGHCIFSASAPHKSRTKAEE